MIEHTKKPWEVIRSDTKLYRLQNEPDNAPGAETHGNSKLMERAPEMYAAIKVVTLDLKISNWLRENDPMAWKQLLNSLPPG